MDIMFGQYHSDELKLLHHRADRIGLQHQHRISPADPSPGEPVQVLLRSSSEPAIADAELLFTSDGSDPRTATASVQRLPFQCVQRRWDSLLWDYVCEWVAQLPGYGDGTMLRYCIRAQTRAGTTLYADSPNVEDIMNKATMRAFGNKPEQEKQLPGTPRDIPQFAYHVDRLPPPAWLADAVIYHVFLDRFHPGHGRDWLQTSDLAGFCGGTLWGLRDKLDYLAELGVNCLWLSPTWMSPTYHGYDIVDYRRVEPRLGGEAALHAVVEGAQKRGIRILLDMVCNHVSNRHPLFRAAQADERSPYRDWFDFSPAFRHGYRSFFGVETMPKVKLETPAAREWMIDNILHQVREYGVDGFRLDVAAGAGANFWTHCRPKLRALAPDCPLIGEIIDTPSVLRSYEGRLDGCLDFALNEALRQSYGWGAWSAQRFEAFLASHQSAFDQNFVLPSFLDNHDMDRFTYIAGGDREKLKRALARQMELPNPPILSYGVEQGLQQVQGTRERGLDVSRPLMVWGDQQDRELLDFTCEQIHLRKQRRSA